MKANEFVKKFGIGEARKQLKKPTGIYGAAFDYQFMDDLKRLVESHELVEKLGGLSLSKSLSSEFECVTIDLDVISSRPIIKAILDVESCQ